MGARTARAGEILALVVREEGDNAVGSSGQRKKRKKKREKRERERERERES